MKRQISNVSFEQLNSSINGYKEFKVSFLLDGKNASYFTFVKEKKGINYLAEAKKAFDADVKSGRVNKVIRRSRSHHPILIAATSVLGAVAIASTSLLVWKLLSNPNNPAPMEIQYIENYTKEREYRYEWENRYLFKETNLEYNKNWQISRETATTFASDGSPLMTLTTEKEYDGKHRMIKDHKVMVDIESGGTTEQINERKFDNRGYIVEEISTTINPNRTQITKSIYNYVDDENFTTATETKLNDQVISTATTEKKSIVHGNEKTLISNSESSRFKNGEYNGGTKNTSTVITRYDNLNRLIYTKDNDINILIKKDHTETTTFEGEICSEYVYDTDDSLSCDFKEYTKETQDEETLGTSKEGRREEIEDSTTLETYALYKNPDFAELDTYCKDYTTYDNLGRVAYIKKYIAGEMMPSNEDHLWVPSDFKLFSYIGDSEKSLSKFSMVLNRNEGMKYDIIDEYYTVDKYNRRTNGEHREYELVISASNNLSASTDNDRYIEREYAEPVPVNPDIPQPE